jgi:hemerythrin-like domain-containing protein
MTPDFFQPAPTFDDPLAMLRACHRRLEYGLLTAERLPELEQGGSLETAARTTLRQMVQYFSGMVPRHFADEEQSLFPRLLAARPGDEVIGLMERLAKQHDALAFAHCEFAEAAEELLRIGPPAAAERFRKAIAELRRVYAEHLRLEEEQVFPQAAALLSAREMATIGAEMAARRGIAWPHELPQPARAPVCFRNGAPGPPP